MRNPNALSNIPKVEALEERSLPSGVGVPPPLHIVDGRAVFVPPGVVGRDDLPVVTGQRFVPPAPYDKMPNQPPSVVRWDSGGFGLLPVGFAYHDVTGFFGK